MSRRFASQLAHQEAVDQIFLASEKQLRPNRNGNLYLQLELSDRSGTISARMWNASEQDYRNFENGDYVRVEGTTQLFQGTIQLIATTIRKAPKSDVNPDDFMILGSKEIDQLVTRLSTHLRKIRDPHLLNLAECFLVDDAPAEVGEQRAQRLQTEGAGHLDVPAAAMAGVGVQHQHEVAHRVEVADGGGHRGAGRNAEHGTAQGRDLHGFNLAAKRRYHRRRDDEWQAIPWPGPSTTAST